MARGSLRARTDAHPVRAMVSAVATQTSAMIPAFLTGALAVQMGDDLGFGEGLLGGAVAFFFLLAALISPHGGAFTDRFGAQRSLRLATVFSAASLIGTALFVDHYAVLLLMMGIGAVGLGIGGPGTKLMVARGVPVARHGIAFGVQAGATPLASLFSGLVVPLVAVSAGWRWGWAVMLVVPAVGFVAAPPIGPVEPGQQRSPSGRRLADIDYRPLVMLGLAATLGSAAATTLAAFFVSAATEVDIDEGLAGAMLAFGSAVVIVMRIVAGFAADRRGTDPLRAVALFMAVSTAGYLLTATDSKYLLPIGALFALGAGWSWSGLIVHAVVRHYPEAPGAATGMISSGLNVGGVVGPLVFGVLVEHFSYSIAFSTTAASTLAGSVAAVAGRRRLAVAAASSSNSGHLTAL